MDQANPASVVEAVNGFRGPLAETMGIVITEVSQDRVAATMPVDGNTQPYGLLHGGASAVLAETVGSIAAGVYGSPDRVPVGVSLHCTHHRPARAGQVHAAAVPIRLGKTLTTHAITIVDEDDQMVCSATLTCLLRQPTTP